MEECFVFEDRQQWGVDQREFATPCVWYLWKLILEARVERDCPYTCKGCYEKW